MFEARERLGTHRPAGALWVCGLEDILRMIPVAEERVVELVASEQTVSRRVSGALSWVAQLHTDALVERCTRCQCEISV